MRYGGVRVWKTFRHHLNGSRAGVKDEISQTKLAVALQLLAGDSRSPAQSGLKRHAGRSRRVGLARANVGGLELAEGSRLVEQARGRRMRRGGGVAGQGVAGAGIEVVAVAFGDLPLTEVALRVFIGDEGARRTLLFASTLASGFARSLLDVGGRRLDQHVVLELLFLLAGGRRAGARAAVAGADGHEGRHGGVAAVLRLGFLRIARRLALRHGFSSWVD